MLETFVGRPLTPFTLEQIADLLNAGLAPFLGPARIVKVAALGGDLDITIEDRPSYFH